MSNSVPNAMPNVNLIQLAKLSNAVYSSDLRRGTVVESWRCVKFERSSGSLSGFQAGIFTRNGQTVVAFRGTAQAADVVTDLKLGSGMNSTYFSKGEEFAALASPNAGNVVVTGHSLGGAIAQVVANRRGLFLATFNAPGVAVVASRNMHQSDPLMNTVRVAGMLSSALRHPMQAVRDVQNVFRKVKGVNLCLQNDLVSKIGNHYGKVKRIPGTGFSPVSQHRITTVISVLEQQENLALASRNPGTF